MIDDDQANEIIAAEFRRALDSKDGGSNNSLHIPQPRPHAFYSVEETAAILKVSTEALESGSLDYSVPHGITTSDNVKWFNPISVREASVRLAGYRRAFAEGREQAAQRHQEDWQRIMQNVQQQPGKGRKG
jgi:hypothetical protein